MGGNFLFIDAHYSRPSALIVHSNLCRSFLLQRQSHFQDFFFKRYLRYPKRLPETESWRHTAWYKFTKISKERAVSRPHDLLSQNTKCYGWFVRDRHETSCPVSRIDLISSSKYARPLTSRKVKFYNEWHKFIPSTMPQCIADSVHCVQWTMQGIKYWTQQKSSRGKTDLHARSLQNCTEAVIIL